MTRRYPSAGGYLAGLAVGFASGFGLWLLNVRYALSAPAFVPRPHRVEMRRILGFGKWQGIAQLAGTLGNQMDRYVLGAMASVASDNTMPPIGSRRRVTR